MQNQVNNEVLAVNCINQTTRPSFVSHNYGFIKTEPIIKTIQEYGWQLVSTKVARARKDERKGFEKHKLIFEHPTLGLDNDSRPRLYLLNSHDRSSAFCFNLGFFRFVCENGIMIGDAIGNQFKVYHTGRNIEEQIGFQLVAAIASVPKLLDIRERLRERKLTDSETLELASRLIAITEKQRGLVEGSMVVPGPQRVEDVQPDAWTVFNVLQEYAIRGNFSAYTIDIKTQQHRKIKARSIKAIDADTRLNKALFDETVKFLKVG